MGKKGKKSKAELEAERIEEERLAEERRVAEEKAEAERIERERIAAEKLKAEQKQYREEELQRLSDELRDEEGNLPRRRSKINALREEAETDRNWTHFRNCVQVPTGDDALAARAFFARLGAEAEAAAAHRRRRLPSQMGVARCVCRPAAAAVVELFRRLTGPLGGNRAL